HRGIRRRDEAAQIEHADALQHFRPGYGHHSPFAPVTLMISATFRASAFMNDANSDGDVGAPTTPRPVNFSLTSGSFSAFATSALMRATMSCGVPAGAASPYHVMKSKRESPGASATAGTSGAAGWRCALDTPSAITLPAFTYG